MGYVYPTRFCKIACARVTLNYLEHFVEDTLVNQDFYHPRSFVFPNLKNTIFKNLVNTIYEHKKNINIIYCIVCLKYD